MSNPKPHIVLVHGAFHSPPHYAPLLDALKSHGYTTHTAQLPSVGSLDPPKDLSQDIAAVRELLAEATETDNDVVVICHSWGGIVSGSALVGWSKAEREAAGKQGGVVRAGYIAAMMLDEGVSMADTLPPGGHPPWAEQTV
jgi:alpha-beta hydrolase superfamily lysophospholipase